MRLQHWWISSQNNTRHLIFKTKEHFCPDWSRSIIIQNHFVARFHEQLREIFHCRLRSDYQLCRAYRSHFVLILLIFRTVSCDLLSSQAQTKLWWRRYCWRSPRSFFTTSVVECILFHVPRLTWLPKNAICMTMEAVLPFWRHVSGGYNVVEDELFLIFVPNVRTK